MTLPSPRLPWALLWLLSSMAWADPPRVDATHPWPWPTVEEIRPDHGTQDTARLLEWLVSADEAQRSEAQLRLLALGEALLPQLEAFTAQHPRAQERDWIRDFLYLLSLRHVGSEQLRAHPTLSALEEEGVARGLQLVAPWRDMASIEGIVSDGHGSLCGNSPPHVTLHVEGPALLRLRDELRRLGTRAARTALAQLWSSSSPSARLLGLALASQLRLPPEPSVLARLSKDTAEAELVGESIPGFYGLRSLLNNPYAIQEPVESRPVRYKAPISHFVISMELRAQPPPWPSLRPEAAPLVQRIRARMDLWFEGMFQPGYSAWINGLETSMAMQARGEQEYWNLARPLWRAWWRGSPWARRYLEVNGWKAYAGSYQGYQYFAEERRVPYQTVLRIMGTVGAEVEVTYYDIHDRYSRRPVEVYRGVIPFTIFGRHGERYHLRARTALTSWQDMHMQEPALTELTVTLWLNPALRRAYLEQVKALGAAREDP